jgi:hypothetical protein
MSNDIIINQKKISHAKLNLELKRKAARTGYSTLFLADTSFPNANFNLQCITAPSKTDRDEYALYEREDLYFVLIDIFHDYSDANEVAKIILAEKYPNFAQIIEFRNKHVDRGEHENRH